MFTALVVVIFVSIVVVACSAIALRHHRSEDTAVPHVSGKKPNNDVRLFRYFK